MEISVHIRCMCMRDRAAVLSIENEAFSNPWSQDDFIRCLQNHNCIIMVAEHAGQVVGFMIYELHQNRLHILNFAVSQGSRRAGVGRQMLEKLMGKLHPERRKCIMLEVRETNLAAQLFFRRFGFRAIRVLRGFYDDSAEDAYLMQLQCEAIVEAC
jgi:ribosomal-protein-alanine N-acetyltransferase